MKCIDLKFKPDRTDFVVEFSFQPARGVSAVKAAEQIAAESSIGTWTDLTTLTPVIAKKLKPTIFDFNKNSNTIKIAYPKDLFEKGSIPQLMSSIGGNVFGMKILKSLRLQDINFPDYYVHSFKGPRYGIPGLRRIMRVRKRPFVGTIVKPKLGLNEKEHANVAFNAWLGGCDFVKDDENLTSMTFNKFRKRVLLTEKARMKAEKITGEKKAYLPNITAESKEMLSRLKFVENNNGNYVMVDVLTTGWSALQTLRNESSLPIHAHRAGHAGFTRNPNHGISMLVIAKLCRLIGVDTLHIGTAALGKMSDSLDDVLNIEHEIEKKLIRENFAGHVLEEDWLNKKPVLAVASGGLYPGLIPGVVDKMGYNVLMQFGGGIHGHSSGTIAGSKAVRQALNAVLKGKTLRQQARKHSELKQALKQWGTK
ncbi:MAG: type III ribulose-bisphosphate carboxylase [archaeon]